MLTTTPFRISVADLLKRPGAAREFGVVAPLADLSASGSEIPSDVPVRIEGTLERVSEGIVVRGTVRAHWKAPCSRCLAPVEGDVSDENRSLIMFATASRSTSPTTITAMRSGRYQSR